MIKNQNRYLFKFAWKSIGRNKGRSFFIGLSVSMAVVIAVWVVSFFEGLNTQIEKAVVNTNTGFYQIQDTLYADTTDSSKAIIYTKELHQKLLEKPVISVSPELILDGNISTPEGAAGLLVLGIVPEIHRNFLPIGKKIKEGTFLNQDDDFEVVIGRELASLFKFKAGDQLILNFQDHHGELKSEILNIKGIFHYNSKGFEKRFIYVNQKTWQKLFFNRDSGQTLFNRIGVMTPKLIDESILKQRVAGNDVVIKSWKQLNPEMAVVLEFHDGMIKFFFLIIAVTIMMTILTPVRMLWQERFKEIKMMNIVGVSTRVIWKLGFNEVVIMIGLSGFFSSLFLGTIIGYQSYHGVDFRFLNDGIAIERAGIKLPGIIYPLLTLNQIIITFLFVIFVLGISYIWSIHRTIRRLEIES
jgi:ABC-type lipoprotein release transport system permease subunit